MLAMTHLDVLGEFDKSAEALPETWARCKRWTVTTSRSHMGVRRKSDGSES